MSVVRDVFAVIFVVAACFFGFLAYTERNKDNSGLYQSISAIIYDVYTEPQYTTDANGWNHTEYKLYPMYKYTVGTNQYVGRYLEGTYAEGFQGGAYSRIMNGQKNINIFYEKANPSNSVLTFAKNNMVGYVIAVVIFLVLALISKVATFTPAPVYGPAPGPYGPGPYGPGSYGPGPYGPRY